MQPGHSLDGQAKENDAVLVGDRFPAGNFGAFWAAAGHEPNFETRVGEFFWPHFLQELGGGGDRELEVAVATAQKRQVRPGDGSADAAAVTIPPVAA